MNVTGRKQHTTSYSSTFCQMADHKNSCWLPYHWLWENELRAMRAIILGTSVSCWQDCQRRRCGIYAHFKNTLLPVCGWNCNNISVGDICLCWLKDIGSLFSFLFPKLVVCMCSGLLCGELSSWGLSREVDIPCTETKSNCCLNQAQKNIMDNTRHDSDAALLSTVAS